MTDTKQGRPIKTQLHWLRRGLGQPGGKLPLFDEDGRQIGEKTVRSCIEHGWATPWFDNPIKPDWMICKLTDLGRRVATNNKSDK
jgi:hypothetical protein